MMSNYNSPEYRTIVECTPDLTIALKDDLTRLSGELFAAGLIADDNAADLRRQDRGKADRAAQLAEFVRNKVSLDTGNYCSFIQVLEKRKNDHNEILRILEEKYRKLGECTIAL